LLAEGVSQADPAEFDATELPLYDALRHASEASQQREIIAAYWQLVVAVGRYTAADRQATVLAAIPDPTTSHEIAWLRAARSAAEARRQEVRLDVVAAQYGLVERSLALPTTSLPWPADSPLVGPYRTNFERLFQGRVPPVNLQRIHRLLPLTLRSMNLRAQAAADARVAVREFTQAYRQGQVPLKLLLEVLAQDQYQTDRFLANVLAYNEQIATYALAVVGPVVDHATLVSTLIKWEPPPRADAILDPQVQPASNEEPVEATPAAPAAPTIRAAPQPSVWDASPSEPAAPLPQNQPPAQTQSVLRGIRVAR
jgi:hypothetical protein